MGEIEIYNGDCFEVMKEIPDKSVDMVLTDPPYGITQCAWDKKISLDKLWDSYRRIVKDNGAIVMFSQMPFTAELVCSNQKEFKYMWTWYKCRTTGFLNAKRQPLRVVENICVFYRKQCTYNPKMRKGKLREKGTGSKRGGNCYGSYHPMHDVNDMYYPTELLDFKTVSNAERMHPVQKPIDLLEYLVKTYTNEGETVLDSFSGVFSTGVACINTGRKFVGIEMDKNYFDIGKERLENVGDRKCQAMS